ncbi:1189_t:CDS:2 [Rhizophagus irregularis]|nr:1189_t:CDS:2 [Rhizophagus irregularis]
MKGCLSQKDYNKCLQEIIRVSSRWILILDSDIILIDGGPLANQLREEVLDELMKNYDINMMPSSIIRKCLEDNNQLSDIHFEDKQCPIGEWGGRLGTLYLEILKWATKNLYHSVSTLYSEEEYNLKVDEAFEELNHYNGYDMVFRICAKKNVEKRKSLKKIVRNT